MPTEDTRKPVAASKSTPPGVGMGKGLQTLLESVKWNLGGREGPGPRDKGYRGSPDIGASLRKLIMPEKEVPPDPFDVKANAAQPVSYADVIPEYVERKTGSQLAGFAAGMVTPSISGKTRKVTSGGWKPDPVPEIKDFSKEVQVAGRISGVRIPDKVQIEKNIREDLARDPNGAERLAEIEELLGLDFVVDTEYTKLVNHYNKELGEISKLIYPKASLVKTKIPEGWKGEKITSELGDTTITLSAKNPKKVQVTRWDGKAGTSNTVSDELFDSVEEAKEFVRKQDMPAEAVKAPDNVLKVQVKLMKQDLEGVVKEFSADPNPTIKRIGKHLSGDLSYRKDLQARIDKILNKKVQHSSEKRLVGDYKRELGILDDKADELLEASLNPTSEKTIDYLDELESDIPF